MPQKLRKKKKVKEEKEIIKEEIKMVSHANT